MKSKGTHWNYRIYRHGHKKGPSTYALHETYYDKKGKPDGWTVEPMTQHRDNVDELIEMLSVQLRDAVMSRKDVLKYNTITDEQDERRTKGNQ